MMLNKWMLAGIGLGFATLWSCPTLAALTATNNFGLEVKVTGQSEDDRDLGTRSGGDVAGVGIDLRPWAYGEWGNWSAYVMGQAVAASDTIQTDPLLQPDDNVNGTSNSRYYSKDREADDSYLALREFWVGYSRLLTPYPGELTKFGRQRLRQDDGQWHDNYIESLTWNLDTTLLKADVGVGQRFSDYRTDYSRLSPNDKDRTHVWGDVSYQWAPSQWVGLRAHHVHDDGDLANAGEEIDDLDKTSNGELTWFGLEATSDAYNHRNTNQLNYWGSLTWLTGNRDTFNRTDTNGIVTAGDTYGEHVNGWATDLGVRLRLDPEWQVGAAYARASKDYEQNGLQSNRSSWTGTRSRISRFGEAFQAELANVQTASIFASWEMQEDYDASLIYHRFWRVDGSSPIGGSNINAAYESTDATSGDVSLSTLPLNDGEKDLGQEVDLVVTKYFKQGLLPASLSQSFDEPSALVRLRAGVFKPGDAYAGGVDNYMHRAIVDVIWRF